MHHIWKLGLAVALLALGIFLAGRFEPGGNPYVGTWRFVVLRDGSEISLFLLHVRGDEARPVVDVTESPTYAVAEASDARVQDGALRFHIKTEFEVLPVVVLAPQGAAGRRPLVGNVHFRGAYAMIRLEPADVDGLDPKRATVASPGEAEIFVALQVHDARGRMAGLEGVVDKYPGGAGAAHALRLLLQLQREADAPADALRGTADRYLGTAAGYGREMELQAAAELAETLGRAPAGPGGPLAVDYARRAEQGLTADDPPDLCVRVLRGLAAALRAVGNDADARAADRRAAAADDRLDAEFAETAVPFDPEPPAGRGGDHVVLAELFTGTACPPCVGAEIAFDAALRVYPPGRVVFVQYHENMPSADPLTNRATEARLRYYRRQVTGTPTYLLDGVPVEQPIGGTIERGALSYSLLHAALDAAAGRPAGGRLELAARRDGDAIELTATARDLQLDGRAARLRFVLTEDVVHYAAPNGRRLHHHVVRALPGGADGFEVAEPAATQTAGVNLAQLRKELANPTAGPGDGRTLPGADRALDLRHFKAVALVQIERNRQIVQAVQVDVPEAK